MFLSIKQVNYQILTILLSFFHFKAFFLTNSGGSGWGVVINTLDMNANLTYYM